MDDEPCDEVVVRDLCRCYGLAGDPSGLDREACIMAAALRQGCGDDLDGDGQPTLDEPYSETVKVYETELGSGGSGQRLAQRGLLPRDGQPKIATVRALGASPIDSC